MTVRRGLVSWVVVAALAAGCAAPEASQPDAASDRTDVWFMQHMVPHLRQTTSILELARERGTRPEVARLADTMDRQGQAHLAQLQSWLDDRGLAPHIHSHQPADRRGASDLERLSRVRGPRFDHAFVEVMTARHRAGGRLAGAEARDGGVPEVRQLAQQILAQQEAQIITMTSWMRAWSKS
jgi:uncharacterized protein (DUF305 family)